MNRRQQGQVVFLAIGVLLLCTLAGIWLATRHNGGQGGDEERPSAEQPQPPDSSNVNSGSLIIRWPSVSTPPHDVVLNTTLKIGYYKGTHYASVTLEIRNVRDALVYSADLSSTGEGVPLVAVWDTKWNQPPHSGAYANPAHNPYTIKLVGTLSTENGSIAVESNEVTINTLLSVCLDLEDPKPSEDEISSGLYPPTFGIGGEASERIKMGIIPSNYTSTDQAIWPGAGCPPDISNVVMEDLDNDPQSGDEAGNEVLSAHVAQKMLDTSATISDGTYKVIVQNVRDLAGNPGLDGTPDGVLDGEFDLY